MSNFGYLSSKNASALEDLLSQSMDLYVLEQVAAINLAGFTDSALPTNLETRFRRLKSLPVSRHLDPVSSSKNLLSRSQSMMAEKKRLNAFSASSFSSVDEKRNFSRRIKRVGVKSRPLVSSVDQTRVYSERIKRDSSMNSGLRSGKTGSSSSRFSLDSKVLASPTTTQTLQLLPKEKSRTSSSSSASTDLLSSSSSEPDQEERSNRKPKSVSWFDKLSPSRAMGCLCFSNHNIIKEQKHNQGQQQIV